MSYTDAVVSQPAVCESNSRIILKDGLVTVRTLQDTLEDTEFAGALTVDGFRDKYVHATSKRSIEKCKRAVAKEHQGQPASFYERLFVAEYDGTRAGIMQLLFHGDPTPRLMKDKNLREFGCCDVLGLTCFYGANVLSPEIPQQIGYIDHVCVTEEYRGKGIGRVLLDAADKEARRLNCTSIFLWVKSTNRAINLYKRHGYETMEDTPCFFNGLLWCMMGVKKFTKMSKPL